jgi:DNA polymerase I
MLIVDGTYLIYKSYYVTEKIKASYEVKDDNHYQKIARNVFLKLLAKVKHITEPRSIYVMFDCEGTNFRHHLLPSYKANRKEKPKEIYGIKDEVYNFLEIHNFAYQIAENVEGDDLIASFVTQCNHPHLKIYSGDSDLAALVCQNVTVYLERKKDVQVITHANFHRFFPVPPHLFPDFKALQGDKSDGLKGVDGLFRSEVLHLFMEFDSIEAFLSEGKHHHLYEKIAEVRDKILLNKKVAQLKKDCKLTVKQDSSNLSHLYLPEKIASKVGW